MYSSQQQQQQQQQQAQPRPSQVELMVLLPTEIDRLGYTFCRTAERGADGRGWFWSLSRSNHLEYQCLHLDRLRCTAGEYSLAGHTISNAVGEYSLIAGKIRKKRCLAGEYSPARCT